MKVFPNWVYKCLEDYGNCALPNSVMDYDRDFLIKHFEKETGRPVRIRQAMFPFYDNSQNLVEEKPYLIAEEI